MANSSDLAQSDLAELLTILGMGDHARPQSPHEVFQEALGILRGSFVPRPLSEWTEEDGDVLWWRFPIEEPPYCGSPQDLGHTVELHTHDSAAGPRIAARCSIGGWPGGYTHWTRIPEVREP